jgi:hypothetical protein
LRRGACFRLLRHCRRRCRPAHNKGAACNACWLFDGSCWFRDRYWFCRSCVS